MASSLNMDYVQKLAPQLTTDMKDRKTLFALKKINKISQILEGLGYQSFVLPNNSSAFRKYFESNGSGHPGFHFLFLENELGRLLMEGSVLGPMLKNVAWEFRRNEIKAIFKRLAEIAKIKQPTWTYAHIMCPHPPFIFGKNGEEIGYLESLYDKITNSKEAFVSQTLYISKIAFNIIEEILSSSVTPPIIIIQADHGSGYVLNKGLYSNALPSDEFIRNQFAILNALYLPISPHKLKEEIYENISPVNIFRFILNRYFGKKMPLLKDKSYFSNHIFPYKFTDVTQQLNMRKQSLKESEK
jgi:hypothetical protein